MQLSESVLTLAAELGLGAKDAVKLAGGRVPVLRDLSGLIHLAGQDDWPTIRVEHINDWRKSDGQLPEAPGRPADTATDVRGETPGDGGDSLDGGAS